MTITALDPKAIFDFCNEYSAYFGIRVQDRPFTEDEMLPCSWHQIEDGEHQGEELDGTCAVGLNSFGMEISLESVEIALQIAADYPGEHVAIVWSESDSRLLGWDQGEVILRDCQVVKVLV